MSTGRIKQVKIKLGRGRKPPPPYAESYKALPERLLGLFAGELNPTTNTFLLPLLFSLDRNNTAHSNGCVCCQSEIVFVNVVDLNINGIACCICHRNVNKLISKSVVYSGRCVGYPRSLAPRFEKVYCLRIVFAKVHQIAELVS